MPDLTRLLQDAAALQQTALARWRQGKPLEALEHFQKAIGIVQNLREPDGRAMLGSLLQNMAAVMLDVPHAEGALQLCDMAITELTQLTEREGRADLTSVLVAAYQTKATALRELGDPEGALDIQDRVIEFLDDLVRREGKPEHRVELAKLYSNKANALQDLGQPRAAVTFYDKAVEVRRQLLADGRLDLRGDLAKAMAYRAESLLALGETGRAEADLREAEAILREEAERTGRADLRRAHEWLMQQFGDRLAATPPEEPVAPAETGTRVEALFDRAQALYQQGDVAAAIEVSRQAAALAKQHHGPLSEPAYGTSALLGQSLAAAGRLEEAEAVCWDAVEVWRQAGDPDHFYLALSRNNLAEVYRQTNRHAKAVPLYRDALRVLRRASGERSAFVAVLLNNLALSLVATGQPDEAETLFLQSLDIRREVYGEDHPSYATCLFNLAEVDEARGDYEAAKEHVIQAGAIHIAKLGKDHPVSGIMIERVARLGELSARRDMAREAVAEQAPAADSAESRLEVLNRRTAALFDQGEVEEAERLAGQAFDLARQHFDEDHPEFARALNNLTLPVLLRGGPGRDRRRPSC
jgi:tetratricopeptide (TPR) repeat protein